MLGIHLMKLQDEEFSFDKIYQCLISFAYKIYTYFQLRIVLEELHVHAVGQDFPFPPYLSPLRFNFLPLIIPSK